MQFPVGGGLSGCTYGQGSCGGGVYGFTLGSAVSLYRPPIYDIEFLSWILQSARSSSMSAGKQLVQRQVRSYAACTSTATALYDQRGQELSDGVDNLDSMYKNPFGGPTGPDSGSDPEVPETYSGWGFLFGRGAINHIYSNNLKTCAAQNPLATLAPQ